MVSRTRRIGDSRRWKHGQCVRRARTRHDPAGERLRRPRHRIDRSLHRRDEGGGPPKRGSEKGHHPSARLVPSTVALFLSGCTLSSALLPGLAKFSASCLPTGVGAGYAVGAVHREVEAASWAAAALAELAAEFVSELGVDGTEKAIRGEDETNVWLTLCGFANLFDVAVSEFDRRVKAEHCRDGFRNPTGAFAEQELWWLRQVVEVLEVPHGGWVQPGEVW